MAEQFNNSQMRIKEFLEKTACYEEIGENMYIQPPRPRINCKDGFSMSVQAGQFSYSIPRKDLRDGNYTHVEVGFPSKEEELLKPYSDAVYGYVPVEVVDKIIEKHGGIDISETMGR